MSGRRNVRLALSVFTWGVLLGGVLLLLPVAAHVVRADPGTLFVTRAGSGTVCSQSQPCALQTALGKAVDGDVLYVAAGTYTGAGNQAVATLTRAITLFCGWDGSTASPPVRNAVTYVSVLDGEGQRRGIYASGSLRLTVDGCTVVRGNATTSSDPGRGGGIYVSGATALLAHNVVSGNLASGSAGQQGHGGGLFVNGAAGSALVANRVEYNVAAAQQHGYGGGIALHGSPGIVLQDNTIVHNTASITAGLSQGGGVWMSSNNGALVEHNWIESNIAQGGWYADTGSRGGGLYLSYSTGVTLTGNTLRNNTASVLSIGEGGGIHLANCERTTVRGNLLQGNMGCGSAGDGAGYGGGLSAYSSWLVNLEANQVLGNQASRTQYGYGGGLYLARRCWITMTNNIIAGNHASSKGGGMAFEADVGQLVTVTLLHNTFVGNNGGSGNGKIAIHIDQPWVALSMTNNIISGHSYGVYGHSDSSAVLNRNLFYANTAGDTGGVNVVNTAPITGQDPLLSAAYHLGAGSPAINAGVPVGVSVDIDGDPRPLGAGVDIGADEYRSATRLYLPVLVRNRVQ